MAADDETRAGNHPDYEALCATLVGLPNTWYPDLLRALLEASYAAGTWVPGGASHYAARVERRLGLGRRTDDGEG